MRRFDLPLLDHSTDRVRIVWPNAIGIAALLSGCCVLLGVFAQSLWSRPFSPATFLACLSLPQLGFWGVLLSYRGAALQRDRS